MKEYQRLSHTRWDCKYHIVFIPKRRKKAIFGSLRRHLGEIFRELARHKEAEVVEGHLMPDHVHMCVSIPPKVAVANVVGYIKGKSAITIARKFTGRQRNFTGEVFWARAGSSCPRWGWARRWFERTSARRRARTRATTRRSSGCRQPPSGGSRGEGAFEALTQ